MVRKLLCLIVFGVLAAIVACSSTNSGSGVGATLLVGTWQYAAGSALVLTCGGTPQNVPLTGTITVAPGTAGGTLVVTTDDGCVLNFEVIGASGSIMAGQSCSGTDDSGDTIVQSITKDNVTVANGTLAESASGTAMIGAMSCTYTTTATLTRVGAAPGVDAGTVVTGNKDAGTVSTGTAFSGSWTITNGTVTVDCGSTPMDDPFTGMATFSPGPTSGTVVADNEGCSQTYDVDGDTATITANQVCSGTNSSGQQIVQTPETDTFMITGNTMTENGDGTITVTQNGATTDCTYTSTATFSKD